MKPIELEAFSIYLQEKHCLAPESVQMHLYTIRNIYLWTKEAGLKKLAKMDYYFLMQYIQYEKSKGTHVDQINKHLNTLRKYFSWLKKQGLTIQNPARDVHVKGSTKKIIYQPFSSEELEKMYHQYCAYIDKKPTRGLSYITKLARKNVLGFILFQGIKSRTLSQLRVEHIKLTEGKIEVPANRRNNARTLKLQPCQIILLHQYMENIPSEGSLFFHRKISTIVQGIVKDLRYIAPKLRNAQHLWSSVILNWLGKYSKRQVQYMAGHKHIKATERYENQELGNLTDQLIKFHPMG